MRTQKSRQNSSKRRNKLSVNMFIFCVCVRVCVLCSVVCVTEASRGVVIIERLRHSLHRFPSASFLYTRSPECVRVCVHAGSPFLIVNRPNPSVFSFLLLIQRLFIPTVYLTSTHAHNIPNGLHIQRCAALNTRHTYTHTRAGQIQRQ